jgi:membrane-associated phospholipid phosphatase
MPHLPICLSCRPLRGRLLRISLLLLLSAVLVPPKACAQHRLPWLADSLRPTGALHRISSKTWRIAAAVTPPVALITYGLLTRETRVGGVLDSRFDTQKELQEHYSGFHTTVDDYTRHVPTVAVFSLSLAGVPARHAMPERAILFAASNLLSTGIASYLKRRVGEARPGNPLDLSSFPSYHTTQAFTGATVLAHEYGGGRGGGWIMAGGYAVAAGTGVLRMLNNHHWSSDVLAGASIGILSTELVYAVYPVVRRALFHGRDPRALLMPTIPTEGSRLGVVGVWILR